MTWHDRCNPAVHQCEQDIERKHTEGLPELADGQQGSNHRCMHALHLTAPDVLWPDLENSMLQQVLLWGDCFSAVLHFRAKQPQKLQQAQADFWGYQLSSMLTKALHKQIYRQNLST